MNIASQTKLLTPPPEKEDIDPYHPVWRSFILQSSLLLALTIILFILVNIAHLRLPPALSDYIQWGIALTPVILWLLISWWPERNVIQPRQNLLLVAVLSGLVASAIGIPLINDVLQVARWLPLSSAIDRIIGYTMTVGIVQELLKYLVIRYTAWPADFRIRQDSVAYAVAAAIGYTTVLNVSFILTSPSPADVVALRVFFNYALQIGTSFIMAYALTEVLFSNPIPLFSLIIYALAALVTGTAIPIRAGLINAQFSIPLSAPRSIFGLGFSIAILVLSSLFLAFTLNSADRRADEAEI